MLYRECQFSRRRFAYLLIALCMGLITASCTSSASLVAKGEQSLQKRKFHDALVQFRAAVEYDKNSAPARWGMARAYEKLGQFNETVEELRKTVELDDKNLEAKAKLANYFLLVQPPLVGEAETLRDEILKADSQFIEAHILTASIMTAQGRPDNDVVEAVNRAIALDPRRIESYISLQRLYMTREKAAEAEEAIKRGITQAPDAIPGYVEYGRFLMYSGRDAESEEQFNKAIAIDGANMEAREALAEFYVTSRQFHKAEKAYLDLALVQENSPESLLVLAEFYLRADREDEAIATLNQILASTPDYVLAHYRLGKLHLDRKETEKVEEQLAALFKINDDDIEALMLRARLRMQESKAEEAVKDLEEVLKKYPSGREPLFLMAQAKLSLGLFDQANAFLGDLERYHPAFLNAGLVRIQAAFAAGDEPTALRLASELVKKTATAVPNADMNAQMIQDVKVKAISSRGLASLALRKYADAKSDLQEVLRSSPRSAAAMVNLAKVFIAEGDNTQAYTLYEKALNADGRSFDAISGIVNIAIREGQPAKAHERLDYLISANAGRADVLAALHFLKSTAYAAEKNAVQTEQQLMTAIDLDPDYLTAYSAYAGFLVSQKRTAEALEQYRKVVQKRPTAPALTMLGILEDSVSNSAAAEKAYRQALELAPETPIAANNLAWLIVEKQGNLDEALQLATMAVSKGQTTAGFYDTLGWIYLKKGLASPAVEQFRKAVAIEEATSRKTGTAPAPGYRVRLGMALAKAGDKDSARREAETSLRYTAQLSQREVQDAKTLLASL
jgi:tetratricopeptide (TPR) repeat protein